MCCLQRGREREPSWAEAFRGAKGARRGLTAASIPNIYLSQIIRRRSTRPLVPIDIERALAGATPRSNMDSYTSTYTHMLSSI